MGWRESYDTTDSGQRDGALNDDRTVLYYVDVPANMAFDPGQTINTGFIAPVVRGTAHPRIADIYAEDHRVQKKTGESCEIETVFTTDGAAYNSNVSIQQKAHKREFQIRRVEYKIPVVREFRARAITAPAGGATRPEQVVEFLTVKESQPVIQIQVTLTSLTDAMEQELERQDGAIHLIRGRSGGNIRPAQYEAGDAVQHGPGKWKLLHTWYVDRGTRNSKFAAEGHAGFAGSTAGEPSGLPNPIVYGAGPDQSRLYYPKLHSSMLTATGANGMHLAYADTNKYIRSPFHEIHYVLHNNDPPSFVQFCNLRIENNPPTPAGFPGPHNGLGWQLLPGSPQP